MRYRILRDDPHEIIAENVDELEERLEDLEDQSSGALVPNHDHSELQRSSDALRADLTALQHQIATAPDPVLSHLAPIEERLERMESRLSDIEQRHERGTIDTTDADIGDVGGVTEEAIEIPEEVVVPKRRHVYHDLPRWL